MSTPNNFKLLLCLWACALAFSASGVSAQTKSSSRDIMRLPANYSSAGQIAKIILAQPPGKHLELDVVKPPALPAVARLLPVGTRVKDKNLILPNGNDFLIVQARSERAHAAGFDGRTTTRAQLTRDLQFYQRNTPGLVVKAKRPHSTQYVVLGDVAHALAKVPALPSGTLVIAADARGTIYQFPRLK